MCKLKMGKSAYLSCRSFWVSRWALTEIFWVWAHIKSLLPSVHTYLRGDGAASHLFGSGWPPSSRKWCSSVRSLNATQHEMKMTLYSGVVAFLIIFQKGVRISDISYIFNDSRWATPFKSLNYIQVCGFQRRAKRSPWPRFFHSQ